MIKLLLLKNAQQIAKTLTKLVRITAHEPKKTNQRLQLQCWNEELGTLLNMQVIGESSP